MYYVYLLTNKTDKVMYVGVTNNIVRRTWEHKSEIVDGFTKQYHVHKLVYFEEYTDVNDAIAREKKIKGMTREKKNALVKERNPEFKDLTETLV